jgi:hypothetical protein
MREIEDNLDEYTMDWDMVHLLGIPNKHMYLIHEEDDDENKILKIVNKLKNDSRGFYVSVEVSYKPQNSYSPRRIKERLDMEKSYFEDLLKESIRTRTPFYQFEHFNNRLRTFVKNKIRENSYDLIEESSADMYRIQVLDYNYMFSGGEGVLFEEAGQEEFVICSFEEVHITTKMEADINNPKFVSTGVFVSSEIEQGEDIISNIEERVHSNFIDYSDKVSVNMSQVRITSIEEKEDGYNIYFKVDQAPFIKNLTTKDLKNMQIKKLKSKRSSDSVTANRLLSIHINDEVSKKTGKKTEKRKNTNIKNRFNKILSSN